MKTNFFTITLSIGLSLSTIVIGNVAEARLTMNGSRLTGKTRPTSQEQPQKLTENFTLARLALNGSSLTGKSSRPTSQDYGQTHNKTLTNDSSLNK